MKTKNIPVTRSGEVKTINVVAFVHKVLDEMSDNGKLQCSMHNLKDESTTVLIANDVCVTIHIQSFATAKKGGML